MQSVAKHLAWRSNPLRSQTSAREMLRYALHDNDLQNYMNQAEWPLWEVFIRSKQGLDHKHVGSLHAADATMAIQNARDVYTRRLEGVSIWVVESTHIHASNPDDAEAFFDPAADKVYRHPTFYDVPDSIKHM